MKKVKQWLKKGLSKNDYKKAKRYENEYWKSEKIGFKEALAWAFIWSDTEEGQDYWSRIYQNGGSIEISNDEKLECSYTKFGVSTGVLPKIYPKLEDSNLSETDLLQHAYGKALDLANYLKTLLNEKDESKN